MATLIEITSRPDPRGTLTVLDNELPFAIRRVFWIHGATAKRGGHRHHHTCMGLVSVSGSCEVLVSDGTSRTYYQLDRPNLILLLDPSDWHTMDKFSPDCVLLALASHTYDKTDYIDEDYRYD
jgi:hypothetical protein